VRTGIQKTEGAGRDKKAGHEDGSWERMEDKSRRIKEEITVDARAENIGIVTAFAERLLQRCGCPVKVRLQIDIAIDELLGNIAAYAYHPMTGQATVRVEIEEGKEPAALLTFLDSGRRYDPLAKGDPDTGLSAEERQVGGLGIYLVKKIMDDISYEYRDGKNVLRVKKNWDISPDVLKSSVEMRDTITGGSNCTNG